MFYHLKNVGVFMAWLNLNLLVFEFEFRDYDRPKSLYITKQQIDLLLLLS